jgi:hypothetical protein
MPASRSRHGSSATARRNSASRWATHAHRSAPKRRAQVLRSAGFEVVRIDTGTVTFSSSDLAEAWNANVNSPGHGAVNQLSDAQLDEFRREYLDTLAEQLPEDLAQSTILYVIGRR